MIVPNAEPEAKRATRLFRIARVIVVVFLASIVAHGCHAGDHGDADLFIRMAIRAAESASQPVSP